MRTLWKILYAKYKSNKPTRIHQITTDYYLYKIITFFKQTVLYLQAHNTVLQSCKNLDDTIAGLWSNNRNFINTN